MYKKLRRSLRNLGKEFEKDTDIVSLKAVCALEKCYSVDEAIKEIIQRLKEKYPDIKEIQNLGVKESISLEKLLNILNNRYCTNSEIVILNALVKSLCKDNITDMAICDSIERLHEQNPEDELLEEFISNNDWVKDVRLKYYNNNMVCVKGDGEIPSFFAGKYDVTNGDWDKIMEKNLSVVPGNNKPVNGVPRKFVYEYCNELSRRHGLQPVYKLENGELVGIIYADGDIKNVQEADFSETEGYRVPTNEEWEFMAMNDKKLVDEKMDNEYQKLLESEIATYGFEEAAKNNCNFDLYNDYAWYNKCKIQNVGLKKPTELGLYDLIGNVAEMVFTKNEKSGQGIARGGHRNFTPALYEDMFTMITKDREIENIGFRVVRTMRPGEMKYNIFNNLDERVVITEYDKFDGEEEPYITLFGDPHIVLTKNDEENPEEEPENFSSPLQDALHAFKEEKAEQYKREEDQARKDEQRLEKECDQCNSEENLPSGFKPFFSLLSTISGIEESLNQEKEKAEESDLEESESYGLDDKEDNDRDNEEFSSYKSFREYLDRFESDEEKFKK